MFDDWVRFLCSPRLQLPPGYNVYLRQTSLLSSLLSLYCSIALCIVSRVSLSYMRPYANLIVAKRAPYAHLNFKMNFIVVTTLLLTSFSATAGPSEALQQSASGAAQRLSEWADDCMASPDACNVGNLFFEDLRVLTSADDESLQQRSAAYKGGDRTSDNEKLLLEVLQALNDKAGTITDLTVVGVVFSGLGAFATWMILCFKR